MLQPVLCLLFIGPLLEPIIGALGGKYPWSVLGVLGVLVQWARTGPRAAPVPHSPSWLSTRPAQT